MWSDIDSHSVSEPSENFWLEKAGGEVASSECHNALFLRNRFVMSESGSRVLTTIDISTIQSRSVSMIKNILFVLCLQLLFLCFTDLFSFIFKENLAKPQVCCALLILGCHKSSSWIRG